MTSFGVKIQNVAAYFDLLWQPPRNPHLILKRTSQLYRSARCHAPREILLALSRRPELVRDGRRRSRLGRPGPHLGAREYVESCGDA